MFLSNFGLWQDFKIGLEVFHEYNSKRVKFALKQMYHVNLLFMIVLSESWSLDIISLALLLVQLLGVWRLRSPVRTLSLGLLHISPWGFFNLLYPLVGFLPKVE
jgi:tRNA (Thr-GGU) A37 N-methylase